MVIKIKHFFPTLFAIILLIASVIAVMNFNKLNETKETITQEEVASETTDSVAETTPLPQELKSATTTSVSADKEMRGVWVTYMSLNMQSTDYSEEAFKTKFDEIVATCKNMNFNALIVQVRPFADALYKSDVFPWSHIISGQQGKDPNFDPLQYMIEKTHSENMQFHAWINPYRIQVNSTPNPLASNNLYNQWRNDSDTENDDYVVDWDNNKYLNPAYVQVQEKIISGVKEIVLNYNVDGIQFDDYFYPTTDSGFDSKAYQNYLEKVPQGNTALSLESWRLNNVNSLVAGVYSAIKSINKSVVFGISPQCNIQNDINMGADVYTWGSKNGYVDYLCPQLYISFDHPTLPFEKAVQEWKSLITNKNIKLYYGLAIYKAGTDADSGTWQEYDDILKRQVEYGRANGCNGFMFYSYDQLKSEKAYKELENLIQVLK